MTKREISMTAPFDLAGIDHVVLLVDGMERATLFYTAVLGCKVDNDLPKYAMRQLRAGAALIDLVDIASPAGTWARPEVSGGRNVDHVALALGPSQPTAVRRHLADYGVEIVEEGENIGARGKSLSLYIHDPSGNQIELSFEPAA
jgi:catechol 2,3-dioxygenase-like lactoylglutathione lyase family enzyme